MTLATVAGGEFLLPIHSQQWLSDLELESCGDDSAQQLLQLSVATSLLCEAGSVGQQIWAAQSPAQIAGNAA